MPVTPPTLVDIEAARLRISAHARLTPVLRDEALDAEIGARLYFKCENLQRIGAFKFRGACNAVFALDDGIATRGVLTHSSGNHGAALAAAAALRGIPAHVVVPENANAQKLRNIVAAGATVHRCAPNLTAREALCAELQRTTGARLVHPYTDPLVMAGQGTAALELLDQVNGIDSFIAPVGGGGLMSGCAIALRSRSPHTTLIGAEPIGADDAQRSLAAGKVVSIEHPNSICDGLLATIGAVNYGVLARHRVEVLSVDDSAVRSAMRRLWERLKLIVEPSSAIAYAVLQAHSERFRGQRVGVLLSGGNVDLDALPF
ncbi:MAG: pyridoxal-phosphate dependent enzyme [Rhodanobacteraceae bacterium]|mgnify:CR=1 FL=1|nr:pyridoxal-phosphate dependent enzyme [Rhodanobacteraceae bacterium]MBK7042924.1 pyridoxal-phosphate dependent enzyme [Rhodanobacteraceae bacterium]MBP9153731.1 pyridoxal-phosphate dependent enzyme [Xanthomonadales bacterium]